MSVEITYNEHNQMIRNVVTATGYWCEVDYWQNGNWKQYRNSDGFVVNWSEDGIRAGK